MIIGALLALTVAIAPADDPEAAFRAVIAAARAGDATTLQQLTASEFMQHHAYGLAEPRAAWLAGIGKGGLSQASGSEFTEFAPHIRGFGDTAIRHSVVRIRRPDRAIDTWTRSLAVLVRFPAGWRLVELESALLYEGPIANLDPSPDCLGRYAMEKQAPVEVKTDGGLFFLAFQDGKSLPLIPTAEDTFVSGYGSTLKCVRDASGKVIAARRMYGDRLAWEARRIR